MMIILKVVVIGVFLGVLWLLNKRRKVKEEKLRQEIDSGFSPELFVNSNLELMKSFSPDLNISISQLRIRRLTKKKKVVAAIIYSWPSNLLEYREDNDEIEFLSFSHIFLMETDPDYRRQGLMKELLYDVFIDTKRLSMGITIKPTNNETKDLLIRKFGFNSYDDKILRIDYD